MILKKPYAFLIKKFRLIHIILTVLIGFLLFKSYEIYGFFSRYVSNVYTTINDANPTNYISIFMYLVVIIIIVFSLAMYLLMRKKEKPKTLYITLSLYYLFYLIGITAYFMLFKSMASYELTIRNAMILRDVTLILSLPQIGFLVLSLIRGVGFDIKKFNFSKDLKELDIAETDNEEFEFVLGVDSYKYFRSLRRKVREFKYYILENKFMFTVLSGLTCIILVILLIMNFTVYNRTYNANQKIKANNLTVQVNSSYLSNLNYAGQKIEGNKYFLVLNMTFTNSSGQSVVLDLANYELKTKSGKVLPTITRNNYFIDLGAGYTKEKIISGTSQTYAMVFEINKKDLAKKYTLNIIDEIEYKSGTINTKKKQINIKPKVSYNLNNVGTYVLGKTITMYESILNDTTLTINSYEFKNKFTYKYEACVRNNCNEITDVVNADASKSKTLLVLNGTLKLDNNSTFAKNNKTALTFFDAFVTVKYDNKITTAINATPLSVTDKFILQIDEKAANASKLDVIITVRDNQYTLNIK